MNASMSLSEFTPEELIAILVSGEVAQWLLNQHPALYDRALAHAQEKLSRVIEATSFRTDLM